MNDTFYDGHDELDHRAKFGEDRTMRAGCRCENVVFVFFCLSRSMSGSPCVRRLLPDFDAVFSVFSEGIALSDALHSLHFSC